MQDSSNSDTSCKVTELVFDYLKVLSVPQKTDSSTMEKRSYVSIPIDRAGWGPLDNKFKTEISQKHPYRVNVRPTFGTLTALHVSNA